MMLTMLATGLQPRKQHDCGKEEKLRSTPLYALPASQLSLFKGIYTDVMLVLVALSSTRGQRTTN